MAAKGTSLIAAIPVGSVPVMFSLVATECSLPESAPMVVQDMIKARNNTQDGVGWRKNLSWELLT